MRGEAHPIQVPAVWQSVCCKWEETLMTWWGPYHVPFPKSIYLSCSSFYVLQNTTLTHIWLFFSGHKQSRKKHTLNTHTNFEKSWWWGWVLAGVPILLISLNSSSPASSVINYRYIHLYLHISSSCALFYIFIHIYIFLGISLW